MKLFKKKDKEAKAKKSDKASDEGGSSEGKKKRGGGGDGIKILFANHIEKMLFGLAALGALFLVFKGFSARTAIEGSKAPNELRQQADSAKQFVNATPWSDFRSDRDREKNFFERSSETLKKVAAENYSIGQLIKPPMRPARTLRMDPELLAARDLRVVPGYGPLAVKNNDGGKRGRSIDAPQRQSLKQPWKQWISADGKETEGVYFNAVTALIPYLEQLRLYAPLKNTEGHDDQRDQPQYLDWALRRQEVANGKPVGKPVFLTKKKLAKSQAKWAGRVEDILNPPAAAVSELLTCAIPPILIDDLPHYAVHPRIPIKSAEEEEGQKPEAPLPGDEPETGDEWDFAPETPRNEGRKSDTPDPKVEKKDQPPEFYLFRYFDTSVKPGKTYRYQLLLHMDDPNNPVSGSPPPPDTLDQKVSERLLKTRKPGRRAPQSAWSKPAYVALGSRMLAGNVVAAPTAPAGSSGQRFPSDEPLANVMVTSFQFESGASIPLVKKVYRGTVANFDDSVWYWPPVGINAQRAEDHSFRTNATVLDIRGGQPLVGTSLNAPGVLLVFDKAGRMSVVDELDDATTYHTNFVPSEEEPKKGGRKKREEPDSLLEGP